MVVNLTNEIIVLYSSNYRAKLHVREIAKLIGKNHSSIIPHLNRLESEKVMISEIVGRNKLFSLNFDNIITRTRIIIAEEEKAIIFLQKQFFIKKMFQRLVREGFKGVICVFGSYADGTFNKTSDIDLLLIGDISKKKIDKIKELGSTYDKEIHIQKMIIKKFEEELQNNFGLIKEIVKKHVILQQTETFVNKLWNYNEKRL